MKPTIGRIVHVTFLNGRGRRVTRPAIIVEDWNGGYGDDQRVNVQVFTDGGNDGTQGNTIWLTSVAYGEAKADAADDAPASWCWPPRVPAPAAPPADPGTVS